VVTADEIFAKWTERLKVVAAMPEGPEQDAAWDWELTEMEKDDPALICHQDNCIDGCCPGDLILSRIIHPEIAPHDIITIFPELMRLDNCRTHRAVIKELDD
jgi:hypothetical protein